MSEPDDIVRRAKGEPKKKAPNGWITLCLLLLMLPSAAWWGFVLHVEWGWFVVPLGVARIGVWQAAGITMLAKLAISDTRDLAEVERSWGERAASAVFRALMLPAFSLAFAAIYHALS